MKDLLTFRKMISPLLVQILFWVAVVFCIYIAIGDLMNNASMWVVLEVLILGPLVARVIAELLILVFRIYDNTTRI